MEADLDRALILPDRPEKGGGGVQMSMGRIDLRIGAVAAIAEQRVADGDRAVVTLYAPAIGLRVTASGRPVPSVADTE